MQAPDPDKELLGAAEVAGYLGVEPVTVYRWCRAGRLPCIKLGKEWRIRRSALEEFLRQREHDTSLVGRLRSFYGARDHVIAIAETEPLLHRLDAAFFQIGEARGALLVKFYRGETLPADKLRAHFAHAGLDVRHLEAAGRLRFVEELDPVRGRPDQLRQLRDEPGREGRSLWANFDWAEGVGLDEALRQQDELAADVESDHLVIQTGVLEAVMDAWSLATQRRAWHAHHGVIWISSTGLSMTRMGSLPAG